MVNIFVYIRHPGSAINRYYATLDFHFRYLEMTLSNFFADSESPIGAYQLPNSVY